jgi:hypothetical protein
MRFRSLSFAMLAVAATCFSCDDNSVGPDINDPNAKKGDLSISITDAPVDAGNVSAVFVTFTEIKVDGNVFAGFKEPKTINILELQNGNTVDLGISEAAVGKYSKIELVINAETDASGASPGSYVLKANGTKEKLELSSGNTATITVNPRNFEIQEEQTTRIVLDFDLRKAIKSEGETGFSFVSNSELAAAIRAENKDMTGSIKGKIETSLGSNNLVVYAYKKGEFNENTEINGSGSSEIKFAKAVSSAKVNANGSFTLAFLPEGAYEVHVDKPKSDGLGIGVNTLLEANSSADLGNVSVNSGSETSLSLTVLLEGILKL